MGAIKAADKSAWGGAGSVASKALSGVDCARFTTLEELVLHEQQAGSGATIRGGVGFFTKTPAQLASECALILPIISSVEVQPFVDDDVYTATGTNLGGATSVVQMADTAAWADRGWDEQWTDTVWGPTSIAGRVVNTHGAGTRYLYVTRSTGERNAVGFPVVLELAVIPAVITGFNGSIITGTGFEAAQGSGVVRAYLVPPGAWAPSGSPVLSWGDTSITLLGPLPPTATMIRVETDGGQTSNEWVI